MSALLAMISVLAITSDQLVDECGWPSAVAVWSGPAQCSGVLVHPRVVVIDPACFEYSLGWLDLHLGNGGTTLGQIINVDPGACQFDQGIGFCVLADDVDVPIAPILSGCETAALEQGAVVQLVGYGTYEAGTFSSQKRFGAAEIASIEPEAVYVVGEHAPCTGDSGSPAFLQLVDGSWRTVGISLTPNCANPTGYRLLAPMIPWIESESGIDVSPCHDAEGEPELGPACGGFYAGGSGGVGTWDDFCAGAPVGGEGGICGDEARPPSVQIVTPADGTEYETAPLELALEVLADDGRGIGVRDVKLAIDGQLLDYAATIAPYTFPLTMPEGEWSLTAVARDWAGNSAESAPLVLRVGIGPDASADAGDDDTGATATGATSPSPEDDSATASAASDAADATDGADAVPVEDAGGCRVNAHRRAAATWLLVLVLGAATGARRRRPAWAVRSRAS